jgi:hypothetical protein
MKAVRSVGPNLFWVCVAVILCMKAHAQVDTSGALSPRVDEYLNVLVKFGSAQLPNTYVQRLPTRKFKHAVREMYEADEADAISVRHELYRLNQARAKAMRLGKAMPIEDPLRGEKLLRSRMLQELPKRTCALLLVPYLLRLEVQSVERTLYTDSVSGQTYPQINVRAVARDVLRGRGRYSIGDTVVFYYHDFWEGVSSNEFEVRKEYLVPLVPIQEHDNHLYPLPALDNRLDEALGVRATFHGDAGQFEIAGDTLSDPVNIFGSGNRCSWKSFKDSIATDLKMLLTW